MSGTDPTAPLTPVLRWFRVFAIALAAISPTTSVSLVYGAGLTDAGTGVACVSLERLGSSSWVATMLVLRMPPLAARPEVTGGAMATGSVKDDG
jgi:hypothetical protein